MYGKNICFEWVQSAVLDNIFLEHRKHCGWDLLLRIRMNLALLNTCQTLGSIYFNQIHFTLNFEVFLLKDTLESDAKDFKLGWWPGIDVCMDTVSPINYWELYIRLH